MGNRHIGDDRVIRKFLYLDLDIIGKEGWPVGIIREDRKHDIRWCRQLDPCFNHGDSVPLNLNFKGFGSVRSKDLSVLNKHKAEEQPY